MDKDRSLYWDSWKGVAITSVVFIHSMNGTEQFAEGSFNWFFGLTFRQVLNFAVPLFLAMSGYFAAKSQWPGVYDFVLKRSDRLVWPYLFWSMIGVAFFVGVDGITGAKLVKALFTGSGVGAGYYVIVLLQFIALTPLFQSIKNLRSHVVILFVSSAIGLLFAYYIRVETVGFFSKFPGSVLLFVVWCPFYQLGYVSGKFDVQQHLKGKTGMLFAALAAAIVASIVEALFWARAGFYSVGVSQVKLSSFIASALVFLIALYESHRGVRVPGGAVLSWLGSNSFPIYLSHLLFLTPFVDLFSRVKPLFDVQIAFVPFSSFATLAGCASLVLILQRTLPGTVLRKVMG